MVYPVVPRHIQDGEPVNAGVASRPDKQLEAQLAYLRKLVAAGATGSTVIAWDQTISSACVVGNPVFWNTETAQFEPGLAGATVDAETQTFKQLPSSRVIGVLQTKNSSVRGDIVMGGMATIDLTAVVDGAVVDGMYYLSPSAAGKLVIQQPNLTIPVLQVCGGRVVVMIQSRDFLEDHVHYSVKLYCRPAGAYIPTEPSELAQILDADASLPGWLPADDASFNGKAPNGAAFGYNLAAHPAISRIWPPIPLQAVSLIWDKGVNAVGGTEIPQGQSGLVMIDIYGIWWMSNCHGDVPWPNIDFYTGSSEIISSEIVSSEIVPECPRLETMQLKVSFAALRYATDKYVVTGLKSSADGAITFVNCDGDIAETGDLTPQLNLALTVDTSQTAGARVLKGISGQKFLAGYVVEEIQVGTGMTMSATVADGKGVVTLDVPNSEASRELPPIVIRHNGTKERQLNSTTGVLYISFLPASASSIRMEFKLPTTGLPTNPKLKLRFWILALGTGTLPAMTASYRRLSRPDGTTPEALPTTDTAVTINTNVAIASMHYIEVDSAAFDVAAGDTIFATLTRPGADGYSDELGVLLATGLITS